MFNIRQLLRLYAEGRGSKVISKTIGIGKLSKLLFKTPTGQSTQQHIHDKLIEKPGKNYLQQNYL